MEVPKNGKDGKNNPKTQEKTETRKMKLEKFIVKDYSFDSLENTRRDLTELTKAFLRMEIPEHTYRAVVYGVNSVTKLLLHSKVEQLEKRIQDIEKGRKL